MTRNSSDANKNLNLQISFEQMVILVCSALVIVGTPFLSLIRGLIPLDFKIIYVISLIAIPLFLSVFANCLKNFGMLRLAIYSPILLAILIYLVLWLGLLAPFVLSGELWSRLELIVFAVFLAPGASFVWSINEIGSHTSQYRDSAIEAAQFTIAILLELFSLWIIFLINNKPIKKNKEIIMYLLFFPIPLYLLAFYLAVPYSLVIAFSGLYHW